MRNTISVANRAYQNDTKGNWLTTYLLPKSLKFSFGRRLARFLLSIPQKRDELMYGSDTRRNDRPSIALTPSERWAVADRMVQSHGDNAVYEASAIANERGTHGDRTGQSDWLAIAAHSKHLLDHRRSVSREPIAEQREALFGPEALHC